MYCDKLCVLFSTRSHFSFTHFSSDNYHLSKNLQRTSQNLLPAATAVHTCFSHPCTYFNKDLKGLLSLFLCAPLSPVEALHLGTLMAAHGYFFPISDHVLTLKDDGTFYRFQVRAAPMHFINIIGSQSEVTPYISRAGGWRMLM